MKAHPNKHELTSPFVKSLKPSEVRRLIWDTRQAGLGVSVHPSGRKSFLVVYRREGRSRWFTVGSTERVGLSHARAIARTILARAALGGDPQKEKTDARIASKAEDTLTQICARYLERVAKKRKAWKQGDNLRMRYVLPRLGNRKLTAITRQDVEAIFDELTAQGSATLANQVLTHTSTVLSWALKKGLIGVNVCVGIERNSTVSRTRVLDDEEISTFWNALNGVQDVPARALKAILLLGQRPGEIRMMRQRDLRIGEFNFEQHRADRVIKQKARGAWWELPGTPDPDGSWPGTKNGKPHRVWVPERALTIFEDLIDGTSVHVFRAKDGRAIGPLHSHMALVCSALHWTGEQRTTPHDLRRCHGTTITGLGFGRDAMNRIQNHVEGGVGSVYDRFEYADENRRVMEAVATRLLAVAGRHVDVGNVIDLHNVKA